MEDVYDALVDLKRSIDKQNELQEEANALMRSLIDGLAANSQEMTDITQLLRQEK